MKGNFVGVGAPVVPVLRVSEFGSRFWTKRQLAMLRRLYADMPTAKLAARIGRTVGQVYQAAYARGLKKSAAYLVSPAACRLRRGDNIGEAFRFQPGQVAHNKGKPHPAKGRAAETQFKPGHRPHTWQPIGSERVMDGYRQRKMTDTGYPPADWRMVHVLAWEATHGPLPAGFIVVFQNKDRADIRIANLEAITRAENCVRNSIHRYPPALRDAIKLAAKVQRKIDAQGHQ